MSAKVRALVETQGPGWSDGAWIDAGESVFFPAFSAAGNIVYLTMIAQVTVGQDALSYSTSPIQRVFGGQIMLDTTLGASSTFSLGLSIIRAGSTVGGQTAFGWLSSGAGTPALTAQTTVQMPALAGNTAFQKNEFGQSFIPVNPGDAILLVAANTVPSVPKGIVSVFLN